MKCCVCQTNIAAGAAATKMIVEYEQSDGAVKTFGYQMPAGPLSAATGRLHAGYHHKCFHVVRKRAARGDAVTGRVLSGAPTAYDIDSLDTTSLTESAEALRAMAAKVGKPVGDPHVTEALIAEKNGGPYPHKHRYTLETYHLLAHLQHAHGIDPQHLHRKTRELHEALHVHQAADETAAARCADPHHVDTIETDWRPQVVHDVDHLT